MLRRDWGVGRGSVGVIGVSSPEFRSGESINGRDVGPPVDYYLV